MELKFIGERSSILETITRPTPSGKWHAKMTKCAKNYLKLHKNRVVFLYIFRICSLKIFEGGGLGGAWAWPPVKDKGKGAYSS